MEKDKEEEPQTPPTPRRRREDQPDFVPTPKPRKLTEEEQFWLDNCRRGVTSALDEPDHDDIDYRKYTS